MDPGQREQIVEALFNARRLGRAITGAPAMKLSRTEGLQLQLDVLARFVAEGEALGGWKVGFTSGASRDAMGPGFRPFGYVLASRLLPSGAAVPATLLNGMLEPELGLVLDRPLGGAEVDAAAARAAVRAMIPAFEVNEVRIPPGSGLSAGHVLADGLANWGVVAGPERAVCDSLTSLEVSMYDGEACVARTAAADTIDDPFESLASLCRQLHAYGLRLEPGQVVITGSFAHHKVKGPGRIRASFGDIGEVALQLT